MDLLTLPVKQLLHLAIEIDSVCDIEHLFHVIKHFDPVAFTERVDTSLVSIKGLFALDLKVDVRGQFLDDDSEVVASIGR